VEAWRQTSRGEQSSPSSGGVAPSRRVLYLSSSLLSVGGGADDLGVESTDPEKTLEEHDFNNFLNCPSFSWEKVNLRVFPKASLNRAVGQKTSGSPVFHKTGWFARFSSVR
jgi:hypothetical protein